MVRSSVQRFSGRAYFASAIAMRIEAVGNDVTNVRHARCPPFFTPVAGHQPPCGMSWKIAQSRAARSAPVWAPERILRGAEDTLGVGVV